MTQDLILNIGGELRNIRRPAIMGIINVTPDSFYAKSRTPSVLSALTRALEMTACGVDILDIGAYSTRPGADVIDADTEYDRLAPALESIRRELPQVIVSVDTFRTSVARRCIESFGPFIINDVAGGTIDAEIGAVAAEYHLPYILMHMRGTPDTMQTLTKYENVTRDVISDLAFKADALHQLGVADIIIDPGFGFAKDVDQNYQLMANLSEFKRMGYPVLVGISRKSMIWKPLQICASESLSGTVTLNTIAMLHGADILRVHDVAEAVQSRAVTELYLDKVT